MNFFLLINVKMPIIAGILAFMSRKNNILGLFDFEKKAEFFYTFLYLRAFKMSCSGQLSMKTIYNLGSGCSDFLSNLSLLPNILMLCFTCKHFVVIHVCILHIFFFYRN